MSSQDTLVVTLPPGGFLPSKSAACVRDAGLPEVMAKLAAGPLGQTSVGVGALEALVEAVDIGLAAAETLRGHVLESLQDASASAFAVPELGPAQRLLVSAFQVAVTCEMAVLRLAALADPPTVTGMLELDGLSELLEQGASQPLGAMPRVLKMAARFLELRAGESIVPRAPASERARSATTTLAAFFFLLRGAVRHLGQVGTLRPLVGALSRRQIRVVGHAFDGLALQDAPERQASGLLPVRPDQIVGNEAFLQAGLRLARDVAGYDFEAGRNPKQINPVLFGLGKPGCGKTVTAHAIGNDFLDHCARHDVPARFRVVRRTDWASSYQNASALNLVRIFEEEVYGFDGVCGVYWPDIDTAFASRSASGLRMEEKQNLGAVFGIFDGTLLPRDGKWFLICDANTMHMDEATTSRIAQNPFTVEGPTTAAHFTTLMRDIKLRDVVDFVEADADGWARIGQTAVDLGMSGRGIEAICGNIRAEIQDFEYPDAWFSADAAARAELLRSLCQTIDESDVVEHLERWAAFHREAEARAETERFDREVEAMVRQLNAGRAAAARAVELGATAAGGKS